MPIRFSGHVLGSRRGSTKGYIRKPLQIVENASRVLPELGQAKGNGCADLGLHGMRLEGAAGAPTDSIPTC